MFVTTMLPEVIGTLWLVSRFTTFTWSSFRLTSEDAPQNDHKIRIVYRAINYTDLLEAVGRESHGEPPPVLGEDRRLLELQPSARGGHDQVVLAVAPVERVLDCFEIGWKGRSREYPTTSFKRLYLRASQTDTTL